MPAPSRVGRRPRSRAPATPGSPCSTRRSGPSSPPPARSSTSRSARKSRRSPTSSGSPPTHPAKAKELAEEFVRVWTRNHDPNAERNRTNPYMYMFGFERKAESIPLTRSKQERNLRELAGWVKRLRDAADRRGSTRRCWPRRSPPATARPRSTGSRRSSRSSARSTASSPRPWPRWSSRCAATSRASGGSRPCRSRTRPSARRRTSAPRSSAATRSPAPWSTAASRSTPTTGRSCWPRRPLDARREQLPPGDRARRSASRRRAARRSPRFARAADALRAEGPDARRGGRDRRSRSSSGSTPASAPATCRRSTRRPCPTRASPPLIRRAILALPGASAERHMAKFANDLFTRMSGLNPAVKFRYLKRRLRDRRRPQAGARGAARSTTTTRTSSPRSSSTPRSTAARRSATAGRSACFVNLRHTREIERESGGFGRYLQNQNQGNNVFSYNFGRPLENYRDKFQEAATKAAPGALRGPLGHLPGRQGQLAGHRRVRLAGHAVRLPPAEGPRPRGRQGPAAAARPRLPRHLGLRDPAGRVARRPDRRRARPRRRPGRSRSCRSPRRSTSARRRTAS